MSYRRKTDGVRWPLSFIATVPSTASVVMSPRQTVARIPATANGASWARMSARWTTGRRPDRRSLQQHLSGVVDKTDRSKPAFRFTISA
jgi:hypothetical protein